MAEISPYATPEASLSTNDQEKYQPKVLTFKGRIGRLRYLAYAFGTSLVLVAALGLLTVVAILLGSIFSSDLGSIIMAIMMTMYYIGVTVISVMFLKRRLNDLDKSGWWALVVLVPLLNLVLTIYILFFPGSEGSNRFGPAPVENTSGVKMFGLVVPIFFIAIVGILAAIAIPAYDDYVKRAQSMQMEQGQ